MRPFLAFSKIASIMPCKGDRKKFPLPFDKFTGFPWRAGEKKFSQISAYSGLCGFVRNRGKFPQITVIFALRGFVGSRGRNAAVTLAKSPLAALKVLREAHTGEAATFLELYRKVSYPDICKTPSKHKPIEDTIRDKILPTRWMKYIKNSG